MKRFHSLSTLHLGFIALLIGATACGGASSTTNCTDGCNPDPESDEFQQATALARRYIENHPPDEEEWDWRSGGLRCCF